MLGPLSSAFSVRMNFITMLLLMCMDGHNTRCYVQCPSISAQSTEYCWFLSPTMIDIGDRDMCDIEIAINAR